ncbi:MAG: hypothetical protein M3N82_00380 [Pseudomonadota bacterium]|nr:hypothetical protein [Pseudomonadota bacterium]
MKSIGNICAALALIFGVVILAYLAYIFTHGELADAGPASTLQKIEFENRSRNLDAIVIIDANEHDRVLGLRTSSAAFPHTWLYLNRLTSDGHVMVIPSNSQIVTDCKTIEGKLKSETINAVVMSYLKEKCQP